MDGAVEYATAPQQRAKPPSHECAGYDIKSSDDEATVLKI